ncbi:P-loop NTPase fold protein [Streptomyces sp. NPDC087908]|uniref:P-loop NTPase fold protein n=1 Tax=Streptomyces sp. NPDC087908 TaxID=3365820 RepID=UPI003826749A
MVVALTQPRLLPLTLDVIGGWGSGKSSLLKIVSAELSSLPADEAGHFVVVPFSPWQYEGYEDIKAELMDTVLTRLQQEKLRDLQLSQKMPVSHGRHPSPSWGAMSSQRLQECDSPLQPTASFRHSTYWLAEQYAATAWSPRPWEEIRAVGTGRKAQRGAGHAPSMTRTRRPVRADRGGVHGRRRNG